MMRQKSPKEFWNLINREKRERSTNSHLEPEKLYFHFKSLHESGAHTTVFSAQRVLTYVYSYLSRMMKFHVKKYA